MEILIIVAVWFIAVMVIVSRMSDEQYCKAYGFMKMVLNRIPITAILNSLSNRKSKNK